MEASQHSQNRMAINPAYVDLFPDRHLLVGETRVNLRTGEVTLPEGADISTAAREFSAEVSKAVAGSSAY